MSSAKPFQENRLKLERDGDLRNTKELGSLERNGGKVQNKFERMVSWKEENMGRERKRDVKAFG